MEVLKLMADGCGVYAFINMGVCIVIIYAAAFWSLRKR